MALESSVVPVDLIHLVLGFVGGAIVAALAVAMRGARRLARAAAETSDLAARLDERGRYAAALETDLAGAEARLAEAGRELASVREAQARLATELEGAHRATAEKLALLGDAEQRMRDAFTALSAQALQSNNQAFLDLARTSLTEFQQSATTDLAARQHAIDELLRPIRDSLARVDSSLQVAEKARIDAHATLSEQVRALAVTQQQLQGETANLVQALRAPTVRGRWGELQLRRVVELAGMLPHCDFREQPTVSTDEGRLRPDLVVQLPGGKHLVVDAKAPLLAYLDAIEATDETLRCANLKEHARQVREHVVRLGGKAYWEQFHPTPEFVVMFLPGETFFSAALHEDPSLIEFAAGRRVVPASPTTLIALLYAVAYGWQQERIAAGADEIRGLGQALHERLRTLVGHFEGVRRGLESASDAYNRAVGSLETRVLVTARRFKELGAGTQDEIPTLDLLDAAMRHPQPPEVGEDPPEA